jgi:uncharacterized protein
MDLTVAEGRVLGCLIEREAAAPDAYPVTLNDLRLACNQATGRDPVVAYSDRTVEDALLSLKSKGLARFVAPAGERTTRYRHRADQRWRLGPADLAVLAVLLLHGVQRVSAVRDETRRLLPSVGIGQVDAVLDMLAARTPTPFAARLDGQIGGETRWAEVLTGPAPVLPDSGGAQTTAAGTPSVPASDLADLVARVREVEQRLAATAAAHDQRDQADHTDRPDQADRSDLVERIGAIERRLARIEAELAALR